MNVGINKIVGFYNVKLDEYWCAHCARFVAWPGWSLSEIAAWCVSVAHSQDWAIIREKDGFSKPCVNCGGEE